MNMILLDPDQECEDIWQIKHPRQLHHLHQVLKAQVGDVLRVGVRGGTRFLATIQYLSSDECYLLPNQEQEQYSPTSPAKLPVTLILALPRPKVLTRILQDSTAMGVQKIVLINSYFVDKSYWTSPAVEQLDLAIQLGLEQAQDTQPPEIVIEKRFKPFVEDRLSQWATQAPVYVAHPYATLDFPHRIQQACHIVIGCERGFIPYEIELLRHHGAHICRFSERILRTETSIAYCLGRVF